MSDVIGSIVGGTIGADSTADAMAKHLKNVKGVDIDKLIEAARTRDTEKFREQLDLLAKEDPLFAQLRDSGAQSLFQQVAADMEPSASTRALSSLEGIAAEGAPELSSLVSRLLSNAKSEFEAGATLPPEFQAELVRSGLESAGRAGENLDPNSAAGVRIRRLIGSEGLALQRNREASALGQIGAATALQSARSNILSGLIGLDQGIRSGAAGRATTAAQLGQSSVPNVGISGEDVGNVQIANQNLANQLQIMRGQNAASEKSALWSGVIGGLNAPTQMAQGALSSY